MPRPKADPLRQPPALPSPSPASSPPQPAPAASQPTHARAFLVTLRHNDKIFYTYCAAKGTKEEVDNITLTDIDAKTQLKLLLEQGIICELAAVRELTAEELDGTGLIQS